MSADFAKKTEWSPRLEGRQGLALAVLFALLALAIRLYGLGDKPFWLDELFTLKRASLPLADLVLDSFKNKHYPSYFLLVRPFSAAGMSEFWLRLPSAVFGAMAVSIVALMTFELRGIRAALVAGVLMALSPLDVQFGQEARSYALSSCLIMMALWGLLHIKSSPEAAARPVTDPGSLRGAWGLYTLGTSGALMVSNIALPWLIISNLTAWTIDRAAKPARKRLRLNWILSQAIILSLWIPALIGMLAINRGNLMEALQWVSPTTWEGARAILAAVYLFHVSDLITFMPIAAPIPGFGFGVATLALFGAWQLRHEPMTLVVLGSAFLAMPIAIALLSIHQPVLVPRYLIWSTGPYFMLAGIGVAMLPIWSFPLSAAVIVIGAALSLASYYTAQTKPRWDQAAAYVADHVRPSDVVVVRSKLTEFVLRAFVQRYNFNTTFPIVALNSTEPLHVITEAKRVWVVYGRVGQSVIESEHEFREKWTAFGDPAWETRFGAHVLILRYDVDASNRL